LDLIGSFRKEEAMSTNKFVRPFKEVVGSFLITLRNQGRIQIENSEIEQLFDEHLRGWQSWHVVDASAEAKDPQVKVDPASGKRTLEFSQGAKPCRPGPYIV
jgi:hypothetical protein